MGNSHVSRGEKVTYTYCAPASGSHYNIAGAGPIAARVYGPNDNVIPQGWIHNLEHGGLVILYQSTSEGATPEGQAKMKAFFEAFPPVASCGPVIARFDQMSSPFQAILWGRVLPLADVRRSPDHCLLEAVGRADEPREASARPRTRASQPTVSSAPSTEPGASAAPSAAPTRPRPPARASPPRPSPSAAAPSPS